MGCDIGDSEDETFWSGFLRSLRARGLNGVKLVISDQHAGLVAALTKAFQKASDQRCRVHFARNLLSWCRARTPTGRRGVPHDLRPPRRHSGVRDLGPGPRSARWHVAQIGLLMDDVKAEVLAFTGFPRSHWQKIWSTNPLEWINTEMKRRSRVVGIFPK